MSNILTPFNQATYLSQVRRLRSFAEEALKKYPINVKKIDFINHGENTTFKITTKNKEYLLRVHRENYHSKKGIEEELKWLNKIAKQKIVEVQSPIASKSGRLVETCQTAYVPYPRLFDLLEWNTGKIRFTSLTDKHFFNLGALTAKLHRSTANIKVYERKYWSPEGLLGASAKFGSLNKLKYELGKDFSSINNCRKLVLQKIKAYHSKYPAKYSLIHADLHFGNIVWEKGLPKPIDFDDCGLGFHAYDIAVTLRSCAQRFEKDSTQKSETLKNNFFDGYASEGDLSLADMNILPYFILARRLVMLGWLYDRRDNPRLYKYFKSVVKPTVQHMKGVLTHGLDPL